MEFVSTGFNARVQKSEINTRWHIKNISYRTSVPHRTIYISHVHDSYPFWSLYVCYTYSSADTIALPLHSRIQYAILRVLHPRLGIVTICHKVWGSISWWNLILPHDRKACLLDQSVDRPSAISLNVRLAYHSAQVMLPLNPNTILHLAMNWLINCPIDHWLTRLPYSFPNMVALRLPACFRFEVMKQWNNDETNDEMTEFWRKRNWNIRTVPLTRLTLDTTRS